MRSFVAMLLMMPVVLLAACSASGTVGSNAPDPAAAAQQAKSFVTYATPNSWGNYGEEFTAFCQEKFGFDCNRPERSQADDLLSAEEIQKFDAEKNNPVAALADVGILFIAQAEDVQTSWPTTSRPMQRCCRPSCMDRAGWPHSLACLPSWSTRHSWRRTGCRSRTRGPTC